jgi:hypothetical protein
VAEGAADGVADAVPDEVADGIADEVAGTVTDGLAAGAEGETAGGGDAVHEGVSVPDGEGPGIRLRTSAEAEYPAHHEGAADEDHDKGDELAYCPDTGRRKERTSRSGGHSGSSAIHYRNFSFLIARLF